MKKSSVIISILIITMILSGCSGLNTLLGIGPKNDKSTPLTLIDEMVNELIVELEGASARALAPVGPSFAHNRSLSSTEREALRTRIKAKLATALTAEEKAQTDRIIPVMIRETSNYVQENKHSLLDADTNADLALVQIVSIAVRAAVKSAAKEGRQELVSKDEAGTSKPVETIIAEATKEAVQSITETVVDEDIKATGVGMTVQSAVAAIEQAQTVAASQVEAVVQATVKEAVAVVAATTTSTNTDRVQEMVKQVTSNAVQAAVNLETKASEETRQNVSSQVVQVAVQAVLQTAVTNTNLQDSATATSLVETVVAGASEAIEAFNATTGNTAIVVTIQTITTAIEAAVIGNSGNTSGSTVPTIDTTNVSAIMEETRPVITTSVITATIGTTDGTTHESSAGSLVLDAAPSLLSFSATATAGTGKTAVGFTWSQVQGPTLLDLGFGGNFELDIDVDQFRPGNYAFKLTATNIGGTKSASTTVYLTCSFTSSLAQEAYAQGISYLKTKRYDAAYLKFAQAVNELTEGDASDLANSAKLWMAVLQVSSLSVDPDIVDLARNKLGFVDYPEDMETLFTDRWMTSTQFYDGKNVNYLSLKTDSSHTSGYIPLRFVANSSYPRVEGERPLTDGSTSYNYVNAYVQTEVMADGTVRTEHLDYNARGYFTATGTPNCYVYHNNLVPSATFDENGWPELVSVTSLYTPDAPISYYANQWQREYFPAIVPRMAIPAFADIELLKDYHELYRVSPEDRVPESLAQRFPVRKISQIMVMNVIANYGTGLNAFIDKVVNGPLAKLDDIIATIESIPLGASIDLPLDLIEAYVSLDENGRAIATKFAAITTAELKTFGAQLLIAKTFMELMAAYDMDYNLDALKPLMINTQKWDTDTESLILKPELDTNGDYVADNVEAFMTTAASPLSILSVRSTARLATAKATFTSAIEMVQGALSALEGRVEDVIDFMPTQEDPETGEPVQMDVQLLINGLQNVNVLFGTILDALEEDPDTGGLVTIPQELFDNPMALLAANYDWTQAGKGMKPGRLFDYTTDAGRTLGAFSPAFMFKKTIDGDFVVKTHYEEEQFVPMEGRYIRTRITEDNSPLDALSEDDELFYDSCVDLILDGTMGKFNVQLFLVGSEDYMEWLGIWDNTNVPPDHARLMSISSFWVNPSGWYQGTWEEGVIAEAAKERRMMELVYDFIAVE